VRTFNLSDLVDIEVTTKDDGVNVSFGEDTLGINTTSDGYTVTPDWNGRRFTLAFTEGSVLYHLTKEGIEEKQGGEGNVQPEGFIADVYTAVRSVADLYPLDDLVDELEIEEVGKVKISKIKSYLEEKEVIEHTNSGIAVDNERWRELEESYLEEKETRKDLVTETFESISVDELAESEENIFVFPDDEYRLYGLFLFPDGYACAIREDHFLSSLLRITGSRTVDVLVQSLLFD
jgi:hypothetical protein